MKSQVGFLTRVQVSQPPNFLQTPKCYAQNDYVRLRLVTAKGLKLVPPRFSPTRMTIRSSATVPLFLTVRRDVVAFVQPHVEPKLDSLSITDGTFWDVPSFLLSHGLGRHNFCESFESWCLKPCLRMSVLWSLPPRNTNENGCRLT